MISRKEAYLILGLKPGANKYEIENRYTVLAKAYRGKTDEESEAVIRRFTLAYDILTGRYVEPEPEDPRMDEIVLGRKRRDWKNLWEYGKVPALITIVVVGIVVAIIYSITSRVVPDYVVQLFGTYAQETQEPVRAEDFIRHSNHYLREIMEDESGFPLTDEEAEERADYQGEDEWYLIREPQVVVNQYYDGNDPQLNYASSMRLMLVVSGADPVDLLVSDLAIYEAYVEQGGFAALDETYRLLREKYPEETEEYIVPLRYTLSEDVLPIGAEPREQIYGLDFTAMQPFNKLGIYGGSQVFTIPVRSGESNQTLALLEKLLSESDEWAADEDTVLPTPTISPTPLPTPVPTTAE